MKLFKNQNGFNDAIIIAIIGGIIGVIFITGVFVWKEVEMSQTINKVAQFVNKSVSVKINNKAEDRTCITEPGKAYYPGTEKCCGGLTSIFGSELPDGRCWCTEKDNNCGGSPICAPCGNGICEKEYKEDRCNCPSDCDISEIQDIQRVPVKFSEEAQSKVSQYLYDGTYVNYQWAYQPTTGMIDVIVYYEATEVSLSNVRVFLQTIYNTEILYESERFERITVRIVDTHLPSLSLEDWIKYIDIISPPPVDE